MFILSMKTTRPRVLVTVAVVLVLLVTMLVLSNRQNVTATGGPVIAADDARRRLFLEELGYELAPADAEVQEVVLPGEFDETLAAYNLLQQQAGHDLSPYLGKRVKCWTYVVTNYPGDEAVQAHIYLYKDTIVGGDISSMVQGGFTHGLKPLQVGEKTVQEDYGKTG